MRLFVFLGILALMGGGSGWALWLLVSNIDPNAADTLIVIFFYALALLSAGSILTFFNILLRRIFGGRLSAIILRGATRQGFLLGLLLTIFLGLQQGRQLNYVTGVGAVGAVLIFETLSRRKVKVQ